MSVMFITVPLIIFMVIVAPLWLVLHYRSKRHSDHGLSEDDFERLQSLSTKAEALQERIHTLEKILDAETPAWRSKS
ncbi:envelope stress response membrane protein PspB [Vibrio quintilis]|uniref:Phage shock protein B n=1 Tax=Vibrio quintilis TaxID=1117707 RepID=A0A1M7YUZ1_9VIBR|nr:envelope stress response membrane protein PspB [Vibrio quintilis]SHO56383.1 Phage shock protein B [Vibrio quintilis]